MPAGCKTSYLHLFQQERGIYTDMASACEAFGLLPVSEQRRLKTAAAGKRARSSMSSSRLDDMLEDFDAFQQLGGPFGICSLYSLPELMLAPDALRTFIGGRGLATIAQPWKEAYGQCLGPLAGVVEEGITQQEPCLSKCSKDLRLPEVDGIIGDFKPEVSDLLTYFRLAVRHSSVCSVSDPFIIFKCESAPIDLEPVHVRYLMVTNHMHDGDCLFEAECMIMTPVSDHGHLPLTLALATQAQASLGCEWLAILDEVALIRELLSVADSWLFSEGASNRIEAPIVALNQRTVTDWNPISLDALQRKEQERLDLAAALRAHKLATQGRSGTAASRGRRASGHRRRASRARGSADPEETSESSDVPSLSSGAAFWEAVTKKDSGWCTGKKSGRPLAQVKLKAKPQRLSANLFELQAQAQTSLRKLDL